jgi:hypothetical protein
MSDSDSSHNVPSLAELDDFRVQVSHLATEVLHSLSSCFRSTSRTRGFPTAVQRNHATKVTFRDSAIVLSAMEKAVPEFMARDPERASRPVAAGGQAEHVYEPYSQVRFRKRIRGPYLNWLRTQPVDKVLGCELPDGKSRAFVDREPFTCACILRNLHYADNDLLGSKVYFEALRNVATALAGSPLQIGAVGMPSSALLHVHACCRHT